MSSLAHSHPAQQGTRTGPWQQTQACPRARSCWQRPRQLLGDQRRTPRALWPLPLSALGCAVWWLVMWRGAVWRLVTRQEDRDPETF